MLGWYPVKKSRIGIVRVALPCAAMCSVAPSAIQHGLRSEIGEAVTMFPV